MATAFKFVSKGLVAENKIRESLIVECTPYEQLPNQDGQITTKKTMITSQGVDNEGNRVMSSAESGTTIEATWLGDTHLDTAPDVQRGETVNLYRYGDSDVYYWESCGRTDNLRRLETVRYFWSNISDISKDVEKLNASNAYGFEVSTHDKHITLSTNKNDGEPFAYVAQINTGDGNVSITDDARNVFQIDSKNRIITLHNSDGTWITIDKKNIRFFAPDNIYGKVGKNFEFKAGKDFKIEVGGNYTCDVKGTHTTKAGGKITMKSPNVVSDSPMTNCTGHLTAVSLSIGGGGGYAMMPIDGYAAGGYQAVITGTLLVTGATTFQSHATFNGGITTTSITATSGKFGSLTHGGGKCC